MPESEPFSLSHILSDQQQRYNEFKLWQIKGRLSSHYVFFRIFFVLMKILRWKWNYVVIQADKQIQVEMEELADFIH